MTGFQFKDQGTSRGWRPVTGTVLGACLAILTLGASLAKAEDVSSIIGTIMSSDTGEPLAFASIALYRTESVQDTAGTAVGGVLSKPDGSYRITIDPGTYLIKASFVSYSTKKVTGIVVEEGQATTANLSLTPDAIKLQTVEVSSYRIENSDVSVLQQQRRASAVIDGVSAQQIGRTTDSNAAEVLQRVTGLSVVGGRYVYVRGLGERYSSTQVNGAMIGTPEPNKKVVPLDLFAAGLLDKVVVQKTYTPDKPGEFGGGVVDVNTRDFPGKKLWSLSFSSGYSSGTTGKEFHTYKGGGLDFLGIDDGARALPGVIDNLARNEKVVRRGALSQAGFSADTIGILGKSFNSSWKTRTRSSLPAYSMSGSYGDEIHLFGQPLGFLSSLTLSNGFSTVRSEENKYDLDEGILITDRAYDGVTSSHSALWGLIGNASYRLNSFNTLHLRTMYNRSAEDEVRILEGPNEDYGRIRRNTRLRYVERGLFAGSIASSHFLAPLGGSTIDLRFNYSRADRNEPDRREFSYEQYEDIKYDYDDNPVDTLRVWRLSTRFPSDGFTRQFGSMDEDARTPEAHFTYPFRQWSRLEAKFKAGVSHLNKDRNFSWRRFYFAQPVFRSNAVRDSVLALPPEELLVADMIGGTNDTFRLTENTKFESDSYIAEQDVSAAYLMLDLPLHRKLRSSFGARVEKARMKVAAHDPFGITAPEDLFVANLDDTDYLPSVNLTYMHSERTNVRLAYSTTINRPDLRELSPFWLIPIEGGYAETGNPELKRARILSYDIRFETFPELNELLALSVFYKELINPIEQGIEGGAHPLIKPLNAKKGEVFGVEVEARLGLERLDASLTSFALSGNVAFIDSETDVGDVGIQHTSKPPLQGQSPYVVNAGLFYASGTGRTTSSLLYNVSGERLHALGVLAVPDIYEKPRHSLDFMLSRQLSGARLKLSLENILNDDHLFEQKQPIDGKAMVTHRSKRGRSVAIAVATGI